MSPPFYNRGDILVYWELSICLSVYLSVHLSVTISFPLSNSLSFDPIFTKPYENVCLHKMEAKLNQLDPIRHFGITAFEILKKMDFVLISDVLIFSNSKLVITVISIPSSFDDFLLFLKLLISCPRIIVKRIKSSDLKIWI